MCDAVYCIRLLDVYREEYPCDHVAMLNLAVINIGSPRILIHETALHLLHILDKRFLSEAVVLGTGRPPQKGLDDILLATAYCSSQTSLAQQLSTLHPDLTMPMFSGEWWGFCLLVILTEMIGG